jgi:SPP1 family predicted phage head-tail adaptor
MSAAGLMDRRVALQSRTLTPNAFNEQIATFATFATVWGQKTEMTGREQLLGQQLNAVMVTRFRIHWRSDVTNTCRAIVDGLTYEITNITEVGRRKNLDLTCTVVAQ